MHLGCVSLITNTYLESQIVERNAPEEQQFEEMGQKIVMGQASSGKSSAR